MGGNAKLKRSKPPTRPRQTLGRTLRNGRASFRRAAFRGRAREASKQNDMPESGSADGLMPWNDAERSQAAAPTIQSFF
jgi:hypothetical protein